jgi:hypothetical protein
MMEKAGTIQAIIKNHYNHYLNVCPLLRNRTQAATGVDLGGDAEGA